MRIFMHSRWTFAAGLTLAVLLPSIASAQAPQRVQITNVRHNAFTVSWFTDSANVTGSVVWGTDSESLPNTANDVRGAATARRVHYVEVTGLNTSTRYYFKIVSNGTTYGNPATPNSCCAYGVTTTSTFLPPVGDIASGKIFKAGVPYTNSLVVENGDSAGEPGQVYNWALQGLTTTNCSNFTLYWRLTFESPNYFVRLYKSTSGFPTPPTTDLVAEGSILTATGDIYLNAYGGSGIIAKVTINYSGGDSDASNTLTINEAVVIARIRDGNLADSSGMSLPVSKLAINSRESWSFKTEDFRTEDGTGQFVFTSATGGGGDFLDVNVDAGPLGSTSLLNQDTVCFITGAADYSTVMTLDTTPQIPIVNTVSPSVVERNVSTRITIVGQHLTFTTGVRLDDTAVTNLTNIAVLSDTTITALVPAGVLMGDYNVIVTNAGGSNAASDQLLSVIDPITTVQQLDLGASNYGRSATSNLSFNVEMPSTPARLLLVGVSVYTNVAVNSIVYNGNQNLSYVGSALNGNARVEIWKLVNPASIIGSIPIVVNMASATYFVAGACAFAGVDQESPLGTVYSATGSGGTATSPSVPCADDEMVFDTVAFTAGTVSATNPTKPSGQALGWTYIATTTRRVKGGGSAKLGAAPSTTTTWSSTGDATPVWSIAAVAVKKRTAGSQSVPGGASSSWAGIPPMNTPRAAHELVSLSDDQVLAIGGHDGTNALASVELYDVSLNTWTTKNPMPAARYGHRAVLLNDGNVLVTGGYDTSDVPQSTVYLYTTGTGVWSTVTAMSLARAAHTATVTTSNGYVVVAGGEGPDPDGAGPGVPPTYDSIEVYNGSSWTTLGTTMGSPRMYHAACLANGTGNEVLIAGGWNGGPTGNNLILSSCDLYTAGSPGSVASTGSMATTRMSFQMAFLSGSSRVAAVGGWGGSPAGALGSVEQFNGSAWSALPCIATARADLRVVASGATTLLMTGGWNLASDGSSAIQGIPSSQVYTYGSGWADEVANSTGAWECGLAKAGTGSTYVRCGGWVADTVGFKPGTTAATRLPAALQVAPPFGAKPTLSKETTIVAVSASELMTATDGSAAKPSLDGGSDGGFCFAGVLGGFGLSGAAAAGLLALGALALRRRK
jgi:hypothetical protein